MNRLYSIDSYSDIGDRPANEDSCDLAIYDKNMVFVVADGLGGEGDGKIASELITRELIQCGSDNEDVTEPVLLEAFRAANEKLLARQDKSHHMKTTAVYLCLSGDWALWAHIGDSRLYHFYENQLADYTLDHSIGQLAVYMGKITRKEIPSFPGRSRLIRALGSPDAECETAEIQLKAGRHSFLLCSDGIWENIPEEQLQKILTRPGKAEGDIEEIRKLARAKKGDQLDNNTAIVIKFTV